MSAAAYTLHVPPDFAPGDPEALDGARLVRDGFSWGAFLVPALWFLGHGHLALALAALAAIGGLAGALMLAGADPATILLSGILLHLLLGLEAATLRRWAYARRGRPAVDLVCASGEGEAETKSFGRWLADPAPLRPVPPAAGRAWERAASSGLRPGHEPVIGLFPDHEGRP